MRIHSNVISRSGERDDIYSAARNIAPGVYVNATPHRSRTHARAFEISMEGNGYRGNSGSYGARDASQPLSATWDEWGVLIGRLYVIDPEAVWGSVKNPIYSNAEHFHWATGNRFAATNELLVDSVTGAHYYDGVNLPADTHKRHSWDFVAVGEFGCKKCSAVRRHSYGRSFAEISGAMLP